MMKPEDLRALRRELWLWRFTYAASILGMVGALAMQ